MSQKAVSLLQKLALQIFPHQHSALKSVKKLPWKLVQTPTVSPLLILRSLGRTLSGRPTSSSQPQFIPFFTPNFFEDLIFNQPSAMISVQNT